MNHLAQICIHLAWNPCKQFLDFKIFTHIYAQEHLQIVRLINSLGCRIQSQLGRAAQICRESKQLHTYYLRRQCLLVSVCLQCVHTLCSLHCLSTACSPCYYSTRPRGTTCTTQCEMDVHITYLLPYVYLQTMPQKMKSFSMIIIYLFYFIHCYLIKYPYILRVYGRKCIII